MSSKSTAHRPSASANRAHQSESASGGINSSASSNKSFAETARLTGDSSSRNVPPKKRGRSSMFKQNLSGDNCRRMDDDDDVDEPPKKETTPSPKVRPARRVKTDVRYRTTDSESSDDDRDLDGSLFSLIKRHSIQSPPTAPKTAKTPTQPKTKTPTSTTPPSVTQCPLCPYAIKRSGWIKHHMLKVHNVTLTSPPPAKSRQKSDVDDADIVNTNGSGSHKKTTPPKHDDQHKVRNETTVIECPKCWQRFKRQSAYNQHMRIEHSPSDGTVANADTNANDNTSPTANADELGEIAPIVAYFDRLSTQHSCNVIAQLEQMFKHTSKLMHWLKRQTARPLIDGDDAKPINDGTHRVLLAKQLKLYDTAGQWIAAKRDSLQFAYADFFEKHGGGAEDYSMLSDGNRLKLDLNADGRITVTDSDETPNGGKRRRRQCHMGTQTLASDGVDASPSDIRIKDGEDFEFLDSKTGALFTNKTKVELKQEQDSDDDDNDEVDFVELIEVDDDF